MKLIEMFLKQLEAEEAATRKCLERIPESVFDWKPHPKSMQMGYLALLVSDMPKWITAMVEVGEINFATWEKYTDHKLEDAVKLFESNMDGAKHALKNASDK